MKVVRLIILLLVLAGTAMACSDPMDEIVLKDDTDPDDAPGGGGGTGSGSGGGNGGN